MYLSDNELNELLVDIQFETDDPNYPFVADEQIQPSSVDLRLGKVFWKPRAYSFWTPWKNREIDLRRARLLELSPRKYWRRSSISSAESMIIRPREMILGRTFERFSIPNGYAGKLEGRSSFARMGLAIHCSADFINPGWRGHMPLQMVNHGSS